MISLKTNQYSIQWYSRNLGKKFKKLKIKSFIAQKIRLENNEEYFM